jgi:hypothetical protein
MTDQFLSIAEASRRRPRRRAATRRLRLSRYPQARGLREMADRRYPDVKARLGLAAESRAPHARPAAPLSLECGSIARGDAVS